VLGSHGSGAVARGRQEHAAQRHDPSRRAVAADVVRPDLGYSHPGAPGEERIDRPGAGNGLGEGKVLEQAEGEIRCRGVVGRGDARVERRLQHVEQLVHPFVRHRRPAIPTPVPTSDL
jgi:hypothetical protein